MSARDGGPAFPRPDMDGYASIPGMTLRDYFAGQALAGMKLAGPYERPQLANPELDGYFREAAATAYRYADEMLAERDRK